MEPLNVPGLREEVDEEHVPGDGGADERAAVGVAGQVAEAVGVAEVVDVGVDLKKRRLKLLSLSFLSSPSLSLMLSLSLFSLFFSLLSRLPLSLPLSFSLPLPLSYILVVPIDSSSPPEKYRTNSASSGLSL